MSDIIFEAPNSAFRRYAEQPDGTHAEVMALPADLMTDGNGASRRLRVDVGQTGFFAGREAYTFYEFSIPSGQTRTIKVVAPLNVIVQTFGASLNIASLDVKLYAGGTEGGTFNTPLPVFRTNQMSTAPAYTPQVTMAAGGTHAGGTLMNLLQLDAGNSQNRAEEVIINTENPVGFSPGTYYIQLVNTDGATATGVFRARWEERP